MSSQRKFYEYAINRIACKTEWTINRKEFAFLTFFITEGVSTSFSVLIEKREKIVCLTEVIIFRRANT